MVTDISLIAVHGNGGGGFRFERIRPYLPSHIHFEAITLPGFASVPRDPQLCALEDYADYLRTIVEAHSRPRLLLGTGIGGSMILDYIQRHADTVDGIILHAPVGARLETRRFPALMRPPFMRWLGKQVFASSLARPLLKRLLFVDHRKIPADYLQRFFVEYRQNRVFGQMFDLITAGWFSALEPVKLPAALLWGERERVLDVSHIADYQRLLPGAEVRIVPDWDHFPMIEQPADYASEISRLVDTLLRHQNARA